MKRIVGSLAAVVLALTMGVAAYGNASPKQNQPTQTTPKTSNKSMGKMKRKRHTKHHKRHSKKNGTTKTTPPQK